MCKLVSRALNPFDRSLYWPIGMSSTPSVRKALGGLLRDPKNNTCADCKAQSHPRWASWSLGVFICIKCAGIHRSLGTHISKVKSVDLDIWKEEHLAMLVRMKNNEIANGYYEARCPESGRKPINDGNKLQIFIKNKYEDSKWIGSEEPSMENTASLSPVSSHSSTITGSKESVISTTEPVAKRESNRESDGSNLMSSTHSSLLNLQLSSVPKRNAEPPRRNEPSNRPDLKKSILSLYSKPSNTPTQNSLSAVSLPTNNNKEPSNKNVSVSSLDDNELFKNVWST